MDDLFSKRARSDERRWGSVGWTFVVAILGVLVEWVASDPIHITRPSIVLIATFAAVSFFTFKAACDYRHRAQGARTEMTRSR